MDDPSDREMLSLPVRLQQRDKAASAIEIDASLERFGCAVLTDHGVDGALMKAALAMAGRMAAGAGQPSTSLAAPDAGAGGQQGASSDGRWLSLGAELHEDEASAPIGALVGSLQGTGERLLSLLATFLWLSGDWFEDATAGSEASCRVLQWGPGDIAPSSTGVEIGPMRDVITLLVCGDDISVQVRDRAGDWQPVSVPRGAVIAIVGTMLQRLTNDIMPATRYRIVTSGASASAEASCVLQYQLPFVPDFVIRTLPECVSTETWPDRYPDPVRAGDLPVGA